jgi:hypothetical protein
MSQRAMITMAMGITMQMLREMLDTLRGMLDMGMTQQMLRGMVDMRLTQKMLRGMLKGIRLLMWRGMLDVGMTQKLLMMLKGIRLLQLKN